MNICGIDQSFTNTAIVIFDYRTEDIISLRVFKSSKRNGNQEFTPEERIFALNEAVQRVVEEYACDYVFIEGLSLNSNSRTMRDLAGLYYVLKSTFYGNGTRCIHVPPKSAKAFALKGNASKEEMFDVIPNRDKDILIESKTKKTTGLYDLSDAYWIGKFGLNKLKKESKLEENL